jgi:hypothetical protein
VNVNVNVSEKFKASSLLLLDDESPGSKIGVVDGTNVALQGSSGE